MNENELKQRTKQFALRIFKLIDALPKKPISKVVGNQLIRSGTSVGAKYRSYKKELVEPLLKEANEIAAILAASIKTSKNIKV